MIFGCSLKLSWDILDHAYQHRVQKQTADSKYFNSYSIRKMTRFTPCRVKRVSDPFSSAGVRKKRFFIDFIPESKVSI
jgi:hypothetical protein